MCGECRGETIRIPCLEPCNDFLMIGNGSGPFLGPLVADIANPSEPALQDSVEVHQRLVLREAENGCVDALVQLEIGQPVPLGVHLDHAIVQLPHLPDLGIGGVLAGKPTGHSLEPAEHPELRLAPERRDLDLAGLLSLDRDEYVERFRGSAMKRAKLSGLQRNARALISDL